MTTPKANRLLHIWLICCFVLSIAGCAVMQDKPGSSISDSRPVLGVRLRVMSVDDLTAPFADKRQNLLTVVATRKYHAAESAGIRTGDILLELDGTPVSGMADSVAILQRHLWGDTILATIIRESTEYKIPVLLEKPSHLARKQDATVTATNTTKTGTKTQETILPRKTVTNDYLAADIATAGNDTIDIADIEKIVVKPASAVKPSIPLEKNTSKPLPMPLDASHAHLGTILQQGSHVRDGPSLQDTVVGSLEKNMRVTISGQEGEWYHVTSDTPALTGFVHTSLVDIFLRVIN